MRVTYNEILSDSASLAGVAINEPVTITEGGQDHLVILSAKEYYRLAKMRRAIRPYELSDEQVAAVEARNDVARTRSPRLRGRWPHSLTWPAPEAGLVIRYAYLWCREASAGREEALRIGLAPSSLQ